MAHHMKVNGSTIKWKGKASFANAMVIYMWVHINPINLMGRESISILMDPTMKVNGNKT